MKTNAKDTLTISDGRVLHLRDTGKRVAIERAVQQMGGVQALQSKGYLASLSGTRAAKLNQASDRLLNIVAGWGVIEDPPIEDVEVMEALGYDLPEGAAFEHLARANWLLDFLLTSDEVKELMARVLVLTFEDKAAAIEPGKTAAEYQRDQLQEQVQKLRAQLKQREYDVQVAEIDVELQESNG